MGLIDDGKKDNGDGNGVMKGDRDQGNGMVEMLAWG